MHVWRQITIKIIISHWRVYWANNKHMKKKNPLQRVRIWEINLIIPKGCLIFMYSWDTPANKSSGIKWKSANGKDYYFLIRYFLPTLNWSHLSPGRKFAWYMLENSPTGIVWPSVLPIREQDLNAKHLFGSRRLFTTLSDGNSLYDSLNSHEQGWKNKERQLD